MLEKEPSIKDFNAVLLFIVNSKANKCVLIYE